MELILKGHEELYPVEQLQLSLFPEGSAGTAVSALHRGKTYLTAVTTICKDGRSVRGIRRLLAKNEAVRTRRQLLQQSYYLAAIQLLPELPPWGALAGVRPTKISTRLLLQGKSAESVDKLLKNVYFVTEPRRRLALDCSRSSAEAVALTEPTDISLYVGIPFCPTRCAYCSFVSRTVGKRTELIEPYLQALLKEIAFTGKLLESSGRRLRSIYIGGGTPSTLSAMQLEHLLTGIEAAFDLSRVLEYTVEGGRPDTLDAEKLACIAAHGASRMSINPQTMNDAVLRACGRPHSAADVLRAYHQAEAAGFQAINMDLIAGLPLDTPESFRQSLDAVAALKPANITVHTLALKKDADLFSRRENLPSAEAVTEMLDYASSLLSSSGYKPYYLYRQKYMSGSFENVGWSREGLDCLYNIYMMEELHSILSLGGGSISKVNLPDGKICRFANPKYPEQYIEMLPSVLEKKQEMFTLLKGSK